MIRTTLSLALLLACGAAAPALAADAPPSAPGNLVARLYPGAGGELFWNRATDDRGVRGYEITVNGRSVGTRDATSYYDATLRANTAYTFTVTAIDTAGQRSAVATTALGGGATAVVMPTAPATPTAPAPTAGAPAAPAGLRASVYSPTNAELFWTRPATPGLRYEVRRDGAVVATIDGVSHYAGGLAAGRDYAYQVIAIDRGGRRSAPASIAVRTGGGSGTTAPATPAAPATPSTPTTAPAQVADTLPAIRPQNASIQVYSSTAAELFWTPAGNFRPVIQRNEIRRDGTLIATVQGEFLRSYFDGNRQPGRRYTYEITAISSAGRASARVSDAGVSAPQPAAPPTTTTAPAGLPADVRAKLDTTFEIANGVAFEKVVATLGRLADRNANASIGLRPTGRRAQNRNQVESDVFACPAGGELLRAIGDTGRFSRELQANECAVGPIVFSGYAQIDSQVVAGSAFRPGSINAIDVELDDARDLSTVSVEQGFYFADADAPRFSRYSAFGLSVERPRRGYAATALDGDGRDRNNALPDGSFGLTASGRDITGPFAGAATLSTLGPLEFGNGRDAARPSGGRISIGTASDKLVIDAFNGDPTSFTLTVTNGGATASYTVPFSDAYRFEAPVTTGVDIGF